VRGVRLTKAEIEKLAARGYAVEPASRWPPWSRHSCPIRSPATEIAARSSQRVSGCCGRWAAATATVTLALLAVESHGQRLKYSVATVTDIDPDQPIRKHGRRGQSHRQ
jgi:hypothetical protein